VEGGLGTVDQDQVLGIDAMDDLSNPDSIGMSGQIEALDLGSDCECGAIEFDFAPWL
jgi:hypothetical protein